ncbi:MAG: hypothetical protein M3303_01065 [Gemmatimonadota bacterium]|nr:hypothetical protein [Gemmatimonadota bacterium]
MPVSCPATGGVPLRAALRLGLAVAVLGGGALAACGEEEKRTPRGPALSQKDNEGVAAIGRAVIRYCYRGGAEADIEREVDSLLKLYKARPNARFRSATGTESTVREVVAAVADQLQGCGAREPARQLRAALRPAT